MGKTVIDMSMSLDGYIAAPNDRPGQGLGEDGMRLHNWGWEHPAVMEEVFGDLVEETGAVIMDVVTDGIESALAKARDAAGEKRIGLMGANIDQQYLAAGLVDEIRIHVVDVLLGGGRRLFDVLPHRVELEQVGVSHHRGVTHIEYRVVR